MFDHLKPPPSAPLCLSGQFVWRISIPRWIRTCVPNLVQIGSAVWHLPLTFEIVTPNVEGRIVFSLCPFPDESADVYQIWCQSVQPFDSLPDFWICDPLKPPEMPLVSWGSMCLAYIHSQMNLHVCQIWCRSVQPFGSFSWICATLVRLLATGRAVSRKNTQKINIYTSKIKILARTCRHQRH